MIYGTTEDENVRFENHLEVRFLGNDEYELLHPFRACVDARCITVPAGFVTDFESIPRWARSFVPKGGRGTPASIIHNYIYVSGSHPRKTADEWYYKLARASGEEFWRAKLKYCFVRLLGWYRWRKRHG